MKAASVPALLVTDITNVGWLTGFMGSFGVVVLGADFGKFITDSRYTIQAAEQVSELDVVSFRSPVTGIEFIADQIKQLGITDLAFEADAVTYKTYSQWQEKFAGVKLEPARNLIPPIRMIKTAEEKAKIKVACDLTDAAFDYIKSFIKVGNTETDIALELEGFIRRRDGSLSFPAVVVSGERSARPHGTPSSKKLESGDFVTMDFGAKVDGYCADMTRTVVVEKASSRHREIYNAVLEAQLAALAAMRPGDKTSDVDRVARDSLAKHDLAQYFGHGLGHGLGRAVHDLGSMNASSTDVLAPGQVWTVEPGVYIPEFGGVRIEDDVVITESGIENFTRSPKELLVLPA